MAPHLPHTWLRLLVHTAQEPAARALFPTGVRLCARRPGPDWAADGMATAVAPDGTPDASLIANGGHARLAGHTVLERLHRAFIGLRRAMGTGPLDLLGDCTIDVRHTRTQAVRLHFPHLDWTTTWDTAGIWQGLDTVAALLAHGHSAAGRPSLHLITQGATAPGLCQTFRSTRQAARVAARLMTVQGIDGPHVPDLARHLLRVDPRRIDQPQRGPVPEAVLHALEAWRTVGGQLERHRRGLERECPVWQPLWKRVTDAIGAWNPSLVEHQWLSRWTMAVPPPSGPHHGYGIEIAGCPIHTADGLGAFASANTRRPLVVSENMGWATALPFTNPFQAVAVYHHIHGGPSTSDTPIDVWKPLRKRTSIAGALPQT